MTRPRPRCFGRHGTRGGAGGLEWDPSLYDSELEDEVINVNVQPFPGAPFTVPTYRNAPETRHYGVEAGVAYELPGTIFVDDGAGDRFGARLTWTAGRFRYVDDPAFEDNDLPGVPAHTGQAELRYRHPAGIFIEPNVEWIPGEYFVDSARLDAVPERARLTFSEPVEPAEPRLRPANGASWTLEGEHAPEAGDVVVAALPALPPGTRRRGE